MAAAQRILSRPYSVPARPYQVTTSDGIRLVGHRIDGLEDAGGAPTAMVFCHGFLGWHRKARLVRFQEELARWFTVYAFDLRGHGASGGVSALGSLEHLDVDAVVRKARADGFDRVVTLGASMGGIAVIRQAALLGGVDTVVSVSTPALWDGHESAPVRRIRQLTGTRWGRRLLRTSGVRVSPLWRWTEAPADLIGRIAPTPIVVVHGRDDHFFDDEQAWLLYRRAGEPKRLLLASRFGHAEDGFSPTLAGRVAAAVLGSMAL
jgi:pimeloyl-ACP methyl ester carboxylesterase